MEAGIGRNSERGRTARHCVHRESTDEDYHDTTVTSSSLLHFQDSPVQGIPMNADRHLIDVSHTIESGMITYRGLPAPIICDFLSREASRSIYAEDAALTDAPSKELTYTDVQCWCTPAGIGTGAPISTSKGIPS
jgi:hypothetical protein